MYNFMNRVRDSIVQGNFRTFKEEFLNGYQSTDEKIRISQKKKWMDKWERQESEQNS
jgi:hypothetical protein